MHVQGQVEDLLVVVEVAVRGATDGQPGFAGPDGEIQGCVDNDIEHTAEAARLALQAEPSILTYVIGVGPEVEGLDSIALAGGTDAAIMVPVGNPEETRTTLLRELDEIRTLQLRCDLQIPAASPTEALDPMMVNVTYVNAQGESLIGRSDGCPLGRGWEYADYDEWDLPTAIQLCPDSCAAVQGDPTARLLVQFGCATVFW